MERLFAQLRRVSPEGALAAVLLLGLAVLAVVFYKERTLYIDPAMQTFEMLNSEGFVFYSFRYSMALNQWMPLLFIVAGAGLKTVLVVYSVSFAVVYAVSAWVCLRWWKNAAAALVIAALPIGMRHMWVHSISETMLCFAYGALFWAWLQRPRRLANRTADTVLFIAVGALLLVLNFFIHPVSLFFVAFALGYTFIHRNAWREGPLWVLVLLLLALYGKNFLFPSAGYESQFFDELKNWRSVLPNLFQLYPIEFLVSRTPGLYAGIWLMALALGVWYVVRRQWLKLVFWGLATVGWGLVTVIIYHQGDSDVHMESRFLPVVFLVVLPLAVEWLPQPRLRWVLLASLLVLGLFSLKGIRRTVLDTYTQRLNYLNHLMAETRQFPEQKYVVERRFLNADRLVVPWATSTETALLTSLRWGPDSCRSLYIVDSLAELKPDVFTEPTSFLKANYWLYHGTETLNEARFNLNDTPYRVFRPSGQ